MINVLLVEDDSAIVKVIKDFFERREDFAIEIVENGVIGEEIFISALTKAIISSR